MLAWKTQRFARFTRRQSAPTVMLLIRSMPPSASKQNKKSSHSKLLCVCVCMCVCVSSSYYICVLIPLPVSAYYYMCVRILLYVCPHTTTCVLILLYVCPHTTMCVLILLYVCPHTAMCPHTAIYVSIYYYITFFSRWSTCPDAFLMHFSFSLMQNEKEKCSNSTVRAAAYLRIDR
jgi:hypothetical protein